MPKKLVPKGVAHRKFAFSPLCDPFGDEPSLVLSNPRVAPAVLSPLRYESVPKGRAIEMRPLWGCGFIAFPLDFCRSPAKICSNELSLSNRLLTTKKGSRDYFYLCSQRFFQHVS